MLDGKKIKVNQEFYMVYGIDELKISKGTICAIIKDETVAYILDKNEIATVGAIEWFINSDSIYSTELEALIYARDELINNLNKIIERINELEKI